MVERLRRELTLVDTVTVIGFKHGQDQKTWNHSSRYSWSRPCSHGKIQTLQIWMNHSPSDLPGNCQFLVKNGCLEERFLRERSYCIWARAPTGTRFSRMSTKKDSLSIVLRTVEEHTVDSSRERSIVLPLRLKRQWQKRKGHRRQFRPSRFVSMVTRHFEELPWFLQSDSMLTRYFQLSLNIDNNSQ